ncbi:PD-(D/E)XK nuclease family protein [Mangrovibacterium diazotrophicum]|uniref:PD-(D/E)XK nuclease superfamily protein n=1 Tax=Mangrovibacterium diazotrophicum TaxID=1261403 RepID=A0A419W4P8_9BACT|nr:PD-(D/E)XK nuclease family protein [Mangrovibacterium diazotrophicum]RKD90427.1 PD-(D/E)XK nuclease superfamily protein [Mangrovibacterium diazotrophicum]
MNIELTTQLLEDFKKIPIKFKDSTYLELCQYPKRRFEEICSRLLAFYFDPAKEHGFGDLFIRSLLDILKANIRFDPDQLEIITEDNAEGKRIDLVIACPDFVIGIENKITADLYNPLETYRKRLEQYPSEKVFKLVLSVHDFTKPEELALIEDNEFKPITYSRLFNQVKAQIGAYISNCNQKYLTHLYDFIETIENMKTTYTNPELTQFILKNESDIKQLIEAYNRHKQEVLNSQKPRIAEILETLIEETKGEWWVYQGWDLGINKFHGKDLKIGIESNFEATTIDPCQKFRIYITAWNASAFTPFKSRLLAKFPDCHLDEKSVKNRVYFHLPPIDGSDSKKIVAKLKEYYLVVSELITEQELISRQN